MNSMRRATTYACSFTVKGFPIERMNKILVTFSQDGKNILNFKNEDLEIVGDKIIIHFTQEESKKFKYGTAKAQIRFTSDSGDAYASPEWTVNVKDVLNDEVL